MARWSDIAQWVGPTPNQSGPMVEQRGMVLHVMQGSLDGSIAWGKNPDSNVSFHFGTSKSGRCLQLVDTGITAWTQGNGNGRWVSVENEDYSGNPLSPAQVELCARLYARGVRDYGWPLALADSPNGRGLGWHGMGGAGWGGHYDCPGEPIKAQRPAILDRAAQLLGQPTVEDDMKTIVRKTSDKTLWLCDTMHARQITDAELADLRYIAKQGAVQLWNGGQIWEGLVPAWGLPIDASGSPVVVDYDRIERDVRDAVADLGEGGAKQVRAEG